METRATSITKLLTGKPLNRVTLSVVGGPLVPMAMSLQENAVGEDKALSTVAVVAAVLGLAVGAAAGVDAYRQTRSWARTAGGFLFPWVYLTLVRKW